MLGAGFEEPAPNLSCVIEGCISPLVFGVDEEDIIGGIDLVGDALLA